jgi:hypothetical protein
MTKQKKLKSILLLTLTFLMLAIMAIFPLVNNASAEGINTTDEYIIRDIQVGDDLSGVKLFIDLSDITQDEFNYWKDTTIVTTDYFMIHYGYSGVTPKLQIMYNSYEVFSTIYHPDNYTTVTEYVLPQNFGVVTEVNENFTAGIKILGLNPDYIPPVEEPEPTPETPNTGIEDFLNKELLAGFTIGTLLLILLIYKIFAK